MLMNAFALAVALSLCSQQLPSSTSVAAPQPSLAVAPLAISWSQFFGARTTWTQASTYAANLVEGGYSDWRLPTRAELQAAIQGGTLPALTPNTAWWYWTSEAQGNRAWVVTIATDANGIAIPSQSGATSKQLKVSLLASIGVRP
jgi:hypothetical protein